MDKRNNPKNSKQGNLELLVCLLIAIGLVIGLITLYCQTYQIEGIIAGLNHTIEHERKYTSHYVTVTFKDGRIKTFYGWSEDLVIGRRNIITYGIDEMIRSVSVDTDPGVYPLVKHTYARKPEASLIEGVVRDVETVDPHTISSSYDGYTVVKFDDGTIKIFRGWIATKFVIGKKNTIGYKGRTLISVYAE